MENPEMSPLVNIALATYNGSRFLEPLLSSLRAQTYTNIRVCASDDGSRDNTLELLSAASETMNLRIVPHEPSGNILRNFENAIAASDGAYVALCDQDDDWDPRKIELLMAKMRELELAHGSDTPLLVFSDLEIVDAALATIHPSFFDATCKSAAARKFRDFALNNHAPGCAMLVNRPLVDLALPFPDLEIHDHWIIQLAALCGHIDYVDAPLIKYRQHGSNSIGLGIDTGKNSFLAKYLKLAKSARARSGLWRQRASSIKKNMNALVERTNGLSISSGDKEMIDALLEPARFTRLLPLFRDAHSGERRLDQLGILWTVSRGR